MITHRSVAHAIFGRRTAVRASLLAAALGAALAGCTTPAYVSPVQVTRFTGSAPDLLGSGPIAVRAAPGQPADAADYAVFQTAIADKLAQVGYTVAGGDAVQVAEIRVERFVRQGESQRSPVSVGVGGSTGSWGSGIGGGIGINLGGGGGGGDQVGTRLQVMIRPSAGGDALWEGRADFTASANSDYADRRAAAERLADALFAGFPGRSGETIEVQ
jgi:hypothetical protein